MRSAIIQRRAERGIFLVSVIVMALAIAGISSGMLLKALGGRTSTAHNETSLLALEVAEHGVLQAAMELQTGVDRDKDGVVGRSSGSFGGGAFEARAVSDAADPRAFRILATGTHGLSARHLDVGIRVRRGGVFMHSLFGDQGVFVEGNIQTDSWDSSKGTYLWQRKSRDSGGFYAGTGGHIGSNAVLRVEGSSATIRGDARPGPGQTLQTVGQPKITGSRTARTETFPLELVPQRDFESAMVANDNARLLTTLAYDPVTMDLTLTGHQQVVLDGGRYFFRNVRVLDQASILVKAPTRVYVTGVFHLLGQSVTNQSYKAGDFLVLVHPYALPPGFQWAPPARVKSGEYGEQVAVTGGAKAALAVYAPGTSVALVNNAEMSGAIVGGTIRVQGNPVFHYDEALRDLSVLLGGAPERVYWRDAALPNR